VSRSRRELRPWDRCGASGLRARTRGPVLVPNSASAFKASALWGGSVMLSMEWARSDNHRRFIASWSQFGVPSAVLLLYIVNEHRAMPYSANASTIGRKGTVSRRLGLAQVPAF
jgi:hypothetical protein